MVASNPKPIDDPFVKDVEKIVLSFYVSNFPNSLDAKNLWKEFQPFGHIVDAFIANKRSKQAEDYISMGRVCLASKIQSLIYEKVKVSILGKIFQVFAKEFETWNIHISNDIELNDSYNEDLSSSRNVDPNEALNDFIQHVMKEKEVEKTPLKDPKADDFKLPGFEKGPIYNNDDVTSREGNEDVLFSTDQENKACSRLSSTSRAGKGSTSFANYSRKDLKGFSFIDEMNRMIEVGRDLGYDVKGNRKKRVWIKELCFKHNVHILGVQETKMSKLELFQLRSMWCNFKFDYACSMARGRSGGLVTLWDPNVVAKKRIWCSDNYIIVEGNWKNSINDYYIINVYGPQHQPDKSNLWSYLCVFIQDHIRRVILFCDLNKVRSESKRFGSTFSSGDATIFNSFIHDTDVIDLPMGGRHFTWVNKVEYKMSKLDRFRISDDVLHSNTNLKVIALDSLWSDHNPIIGTNITYTSLLIHEFKKKKRKKKGRK
ncbi:RNA-directed DNA polymerase, eukaryota, reverse transcriptase zinc-binding domain protein [Tanacetum coccineum]